MLHPTRPLVCAVVAALLAGVAPGCKDKPAAAPATAPAAVATMATADLNGVTFQYPADWKVTKTPDGKGINVSGPTDGDWEPNVFFEIQPVQADMSLDQQLVASAELLGARMTDYRFRSREELDHPAGFKYGRIEYTNTSDEGDVKVPLQKWSILIPLSKTTRVQVQAAAASAVWSKHQPTFEKIVESVRVPK